MDQQSKIEDTRFVYDFLSLGKSSNFTSINNQNILNIFYQYHVVNVMVMVLDT